MTYALLTVAIALVVLATVAVGGLVWTAKRLVDAVDGHRKEAVRAAEYEGIAKEQAAETVRAQEAIKHIEALHRVERERADFIEGLLNDSLNDAASPATAARGTGREQLRLARSQAASLAKRLGNHAAGPDRARALDSGDALPLPAIPAAAGKRRGGRGGGEDPTLPGDE